MTLITALLLFCAGLVAGTINAVAGGGTFITFGALSLAGVPPIVANATSSVSQFPGYITSTLAYWSDIKKIWKSVLVLCVCSAIGSLVGAVMLIALDNDSFQAMVPWLLLAATALFAAGPWLKPRPVHGASPRRSMVPGAIAQLITAVYGGFFGAGMGVMMLATLGLFQEGDYHRLNALKNMLSIIIAGAAILVFWTGGVVDWLSALALLPGVAIGGYVGVGIAKRVPQVFVRAFVVLVGCGLAYYYASR